MTTYMKPYCCCLGIIAIMVVIISAAEAVATPSATTAKADRQGNKYSPMRHRMGAPRHLNTITRISTPSEGVELNNAEHKAMIKWMQRDELHDQHYLGIIALPERAQRLCKQRCPMHSTAPTMLSLSLLHLPGNLILSHLTLT